MARGILYFKISYESTTFMKFSGFTQNFKNFYYKAFFNKPTRLGATANLKF